MTEPVPGNPTISSWFQHEMNLLPEFMALGPGHTWAWQVPDGAGPGPHLVWQQIGPGRGVGPLGRPILAANYRVQWRIAYEGESMVSLIPYAQAVSKRLNNARREVAPNGQSLSIMVIITDLPPLPVDDSGRPMQELGGEVEIFVDFGVSE